MGNIIMITGATGFLGKVVVQEILRCENGRKLEKIIVLIRPKENQTAERRFFDEVASSLCFSKLPKTWIFKINVVSANLRHERCGIEEDIYHQLCSQITHIIHCAGSVAFSPSASESIIGDNITATLNVMELARGCPNLRHFVHTSTAYVTPHTKKPIIETLPPLFQSARCLYAAIQKDSNSTDEILRSTGHPNLYTLAKCLTEHILLESVAVPLTIVRPSIISASWKYPFPGWVDSSSALAGLVAGIGSGNIRVANGDPRTILDVVPVDVVAQQLIEAVLSPSTLGRPPQIVHAVSTVEAGMQISLACSAIVKYFTLHRVFRKPKMSYIGQKTDLRYRLSHFVQHQLPQALAKTLAIAKRNNHQIQRIERAKSAELKANTIFEPFTQHTYNFHSATTMLGLDYDPYEYLKIVCQGVRIYLLQKDATKAVFAGKRADTTGGIGTLSWSRRQEHGTIPVSISSTVLRGTFKRTFASVTFDLHSFSAAMEGISPETRVIVAPTHRSFLDSLVCSYLFFTRPEMGIRLPRVLASEEFAKIPIVGWICRRLRTVFVVRGAGKPDDSLDQQLAELVRSGDNLLFFVEGQRSRTGEVLPGKRGVLRSLQSTGSDFVILPVYITYERIPESDAFKRELQGGPKQRPNLPGLLKWTRKMLRGDVDLGEAHVVCATPLLLGPNTDIYDLVDELGEALHGNKS
uniref:Fatty acyl-CoA reductase n=1 Tax=Bionectria ochroleuca TaxID=29856 RepID=A0A8H7K819_BIOOC